MLVGIGASPRFDSHALPNMFSGFDPHRAFSAKSEQLTERVGELSHDGGKLPMFDSACRGSPLDPTRTASIDLPAGTYSARRCIEWQGPVLGADGQPHDVMVEVFELRRS